MPGMYRSILRAIGVVDDLFDLVLDLLLGDGAVGHGRVLRFRFLLAVEGTQECLVGRLTLLLGRTLPHHHNRFYSK